MAAWRLLILHLLNFPPTYLSCCKEAILTLTSLNQKISDFSNLSDEGGQMTLVSLVFVTRLMLLSSFMSLQSNSVFSFSVVYSSNEIHSPSFADLKSFESSSPFA